MGIIATLGAAAIGASSASKAAHAQTKAANKDIAFQRETRDLITKRLDPFYNGGIGANNALNYEMGLGAKPADYTGFQASPGYQYALDQGNNNINALAGARGGLNSGRTMEALQANGIGMANQEYGNWLSRLSGMQANGQNAAGMQANAATNAAGAVSNAYSNIGSAQSAGAIGVGNAFKEGLTNGLGIWQYQKGLTKSVSPSYGGQYASTRNGGGY